MAPEDETWDVSAALRPRQPEQAPQCMIVLNTPIPDSYTKLFERLWCAAAYRILADGAANRVYDYAASRSGAPLPLPSLIIGDLDSIRPDVRAHYEAQSEYATDLEKSIFALERYEVECDVAHELLIFGGLTGRLDQSAHTLHILWQLAPGVPDMGPGPTPENEEDNLGVVQKRHRVLVASDGCVTCLLCAGTHTLRHDRGILGKACGLLPLGVAAARVHTEGFEWNLRTPTAAHTDGNVSTLGGFMSTSNHFAPDNKHGVVTVSTDAPLYWTVELQDDNVRRDM